MTSRPKPQHFTSVEAAAEVLLGFLGRRARIATPLGLGKPNTLLNLLYAYAKSHPEMSLEIHTALSLNPPTPGEDLARRFFGPFRDRHWGKDYPRLQYALDAVKGKLPPNVRVHEFYLQAGGSLGSDTLQRDYQSVNYTHVAARVHEQGIQAIVQLVAKRSTPEGDRFSLSGNPDLTLDVVDLYRASGKPFRMVGVVHPDLPFLGGEDEVGPEFFDLLVDDPQVRHELFALPRLPVDPADHAIGCYASQLVSDGGTLQIGIGSLADAIVSALILRHREPNRYAAITHAQWSGKARPDCVPTDLGPFAQGLYGLSEMVMDGFMHLRQAGILKREVIDERSGTRTYLHGAFFLGSKPFYQWLRDLSAEDFAGLRMGRVSKVNDLYDPHEVALRLQRTRARFFNTCMQVTLLGGAASETLENGRVVSGVGGQYNFVAMAHELPDARSILMLRSTRTAGGKRSSNIVPAHGHLTIPRHLRDIVITEYGVADLRGQCDEECIKRLIAISDAEFQDELVSLARKSGKLAPGYQVPAWARQNTQAALEAFTRAHRGEGAFETFPFGSDFTPEEERLVVALGRLQAAQSSSRRALWALARRAGWGAEYAHQLRAFAPELRRMGFESVGGLKERISRRLLVGALREVG